MVKLEKVSLEKFCDELKEVPVHHQGFNFLLDNKLNIVLTEYFSKYTKKEMEQKKNLVNELVYYDQVLMIDVVLSKNACYDQFSKVSKWFIKTGKKYSINELEYSYMIFITEGDKFKIKENNKKKLSVSELESMIDSFNIYVANNGKYKEPILEEIIISFPESIKEIKKALKGSLLENADLYVKVCKKLNIDILDGLLDDFLPKRVNDKATFFISSLDTPKMKTLSNLGATFVGDNYSFNGKSLIECLIDSNRKDLIDLIPSVKTIKVNDGALQEDQDLKVKSLPDKYEHIKTFYNYLKTKEIVKNDDNKEMQKMRTKI